MRKRLAATMAACIALALAASAAEGKRAVKLVDVRDNFMYPHSVHIRKGDDVKWVWRDTENAHNVTCRPTRHGCTRADNVHSSTKTGGSYRVRFLRRGAFRFVCTIHRGKMYTNVYVK